MRYASIIFALYLVEVLTNSTVHAFSAAIARAFKRERRKKKLSMSAVAVQAGISQQMVSYVERGIRKPTIDTIFRISVALDVDLGSIITAAAKRAKK